MDTIKEFIFTASPWGKSDPGWMVFATSPGFDTKLVDKCAHWFRYEKPEGMPGDPPEEELGRYPVQYVVARPFGDKTVLVSQTTFTGQRWYDPRPGDWFAHGLVVPGQEGVRTSPFAWYRSPDILTRYQDEWKEKARAIREKTIPWEAPPALPEPGSMEEVEVNWEYAWESVLDRMPEGAWGKIGALLGACVKRAAGAKALVFDATKAESLDTMATLLELLPVRMRWEAQFATYFHADNVRETKAEETFLFYGTVRKGEQADEETGVYGVMQSGRLTFRGREDAELFKRMVDMCGEGLGTEQWDDLVACWEVAAGRVDNPGQLRDAVKFAKRYPGLEAEVAEGLAGAFADSGVGSDGGRAVALVAWFELGMPAFGDVAKEICGECAGDGVLFEGALRALEGDGPKAAFLDETYEQAKSLEELPRLAAMWMGCGPETKRQVPASGRDRPFGRFTALVDRFAGIRGNAAQKMVADEHAEGMLDEVEQAERVLGRGFEGMEATQRELRYLVARRRVKGIGDLKTFAKEASSLGIAKDRVRGDGLKKVPLGRIPADQLEVSVAAFGAIGVTPQEIIASVPDDRLLVALDALVSIGANRDEIIRRALAAAEKAEYNRGYERGRRDAQQRAEEEARERNRGHVWVVLKRILIVVALMVLCFAAGYGLRCLTGKAGEESVEGMEASGEVVSGTVTEVGMAEKAIAIQPTDEPSSTPIPPGKEPAPRGVTAPVTEKEPGEGLMEYGQGAGRVESQKVPEGRASSSSAQGYGSSPSARSLGGTDAATGRKTEGVPPPVPKPIQESEESIGGAVSAGGNPVVAGESAVAGKRGRESSGARLREVREATGGGNPYGKDRITKTEEKTSPGE